MAHSLSYPIDNNRQPDRKEISREAERLCDVAVWDEEALHLGKHDLYIKLW